MQLKKKWKDFGKKKRNVAIERIKSNASALAVSSDSNIDEVKPRKSFKEQSFVYPNVEFLQVAINHFNPILAKLSFEP